MNRNIRDLKKVLLKKKIYIFLITIIFAVTGICYTLTNVKYTSVQKILLGNSENITLMDTYKELITSSTILDKVAENLGNKMSTEELSKVVAVKTIENTNMIEIKVSGVNEEDVQELSDEISKVFIETVDKIYENKGLYSVDKMASFSNQDNLAAVGMICAVVGFLFSCLFFVIGEILDTKIKSCIDIEELTGIQSLITIPHIKKMAKKELSLKNMQIDNNEAFKMLMTNIQFLDFDNTRSKSIMVTGPNPMEGKTYVATNLALAFALAGKKVMLIDADMRRGQIAKIFNLPSSLGFSNYLSNLDLNGNTIHERIIKFICDSGVRNLQIIPAGNRPPNPEQLMDDKKVEELIHDLKVFYDVIIIDTVSTLEAREAYGIARACDLALILSSYKSTKKEELWIAYQQMRGVPGLALGMVLNKIPKRKWYVKSNRKKKIQETVKKEKENFVESKIKAVVAKLKDKSKNVKQQVARYKNKRKKVKLLEAARDGEIEDSDNVIKAVFESKMAERKREEAYKRKLDHLKANIENSNRAEKIRMRKWPAHVSKKETDLKREFEERKKESVTENKQESDLKKEEKIVEREGKIIRFPEVDLTMPENITEDMIRRQVEMDEMARLAEKDEQAEQLDRKRKKLDEKINRKMKRREIWNSFRKSTKLKKETADAARSRKNESRMEEKMKKETEKNENRARMARIKEEKKYYRELERQKQREEMRIDEEIEEDNLYPKLKF